jgi:flagellar motor switch protein FliN/FliY
LEEDAQTTMDGMIAPSVAEFSTEGLPHLPREALDRSRLLARAVGASMRAERIKVRGLGLLSVAAEWVAVTPWGFEDEARDSALVLVRNGVGGRLIVDPAFALGAVRSVLGLPPAVVLRPLSAVERGMLGAIIAALLPALAPGTSLSFDLDPYIDPPVAILGFSLRTPELSGTMALHVPDGWLAGCGGVIREDEARLIDATVRAELAVTTLGREALLSAAAGDVLVFERISPLADETAWPCEIRLGSYRAAAESLPTGELRLLQRFSWSPRQGGWMSDDDKFAPPPLDHDPTAALATAPVEVVAEIGRVVLRGDEALGLLKGSVIGLGPRRRDLVTLRVAGRPWARGELVKIEDELGVRVTELLRSR